MILDLEVIAREFFGPADLFGAQTFHVYKPTKGIVIGKHEKFMLRAFQAVPLSFESLNNG